MSTHIKQLIKRYDLHAILLAGPGHAVPAGLAGQTLTDAVSAAMQFAAGCSGFSRDGPLIGRE